MLLIYLFLKIIAYILHFWKRNFEKRGLKKTYILLHPRSINAALETHTFLSHCTLPHFHIAKCKCVHDFIIAYHMQSITYNSASAGYRSLHFLSVWSEMTENCSRQEILFKVQVEEQGITKECEKGGAHKVIPINGEQWLWSDWN